MIIIPHKDYDIAENIKLTIFDIKCLNDDLINLLDEKFVEICEGSAGSSLANVKRRVKLLYTNKNNTWITGATAEFFLHLYMKLLGFKQECLFLNLEENSIKKGFDGYYSLQEVPWLMESKAGIITSSGSTHRNKVRIAMKDLDNKVSGSSEERENNPWRNAYSHASSMDVAASPDIRKEIKKLADDYDNGKYRSIQDFNIMPCGTIFLSGIWNEPNYDVIKKSIYDLSDKLKGRNIHVFCATINSIKVIIDYVNMEN